jgi:protein arginine kinase activator
MRENDRTCEACGLRRATVHLTELVDGQAAQRHLCKHCYEEKEGVELPPAAVLAQILSVVAPELEEMGARQCPACSINYLEFRQNLTLGCPNDYEVFGSALEQLIERIHGATVHCGKVRSEAGAGVAIEGRLRALRQRQEEAVSEENYELAAELRDRIRELQKDGSDEAEQ